MLETETSERASPGKRRWQLWHKKNGFCCGGHGIHGPDRAVYYLSASLVVGGGALYIGCMVPAMWDGAVLPLYWNYAQLPVFAIMWLIAVVSMFRAAYTDPGILPRLPPPSKSKNQADDPYLAAINTPQNLTVMLNGVVTIIKWCPTCNIYRPPRSSHCAVCDNCVMDFDHHCPYLGTCIGRRNYRYFLYFISSLFLTCLFGLGHSVAYVIVMAVRYGYPDSFSLFPYYFVTAHFLAVLALVTCILVGMLLSLHIELVTGNRTTYENIKGAALHNPFDAGCSANWHRACCPPTYPAAVDLTEVVLAPAAPLSLS